MTGNTNSTIGEMTIVLPDNPSDVSLQGSSQTIAVAWDEPTDSEVEIEKYRVYLSKGDTVPTSLKEMTCVATVSDDSTSYTIENLENDYKYYIAVESVSAKGYENASMRNVGDVSISELIFVCGGYDYNVYRSIGGGAWSEIQLSSTNSNYIYGLTYGNGKFIQVGTNGKSYYSLDGISWVSMSGLNTSYDYYGVTYGDDRFVCVGEGGKSYYSTNGTSWVVMSGLSASYYYFGVTYSNGRFVCVGEGGKSYYSTNGTSWVAMSGLNTSKHYYEVTYGDDRFVCVGDGGSYYSTNGTTWIAMSGLSSSTGYRGVTFGNGIFVCVGAYGVSYYSTDGTTWIAMSGIDDLASTNQLESVTYGSGRFVCVGGSGHSYYSMNGKTWTPMSGLDSTTHFMCVTSNQ